MLRNPFILGLVAIIIVLAVIIWMVWSRGNELRGVASLLTAAFWILVGLVPLLVRRAKEEQRRRRENARAGRNYDAIE